MRLCPESVPQRPKRSGRGHCGSSSAGHPDHSLQFRPNPNPNTVACSKPQPVGESSANAISDGVPIAERRCDHSCFRPLTADR